MNDTFIQFTSPIESGLADHPQHATAIGMISIEIASMESSFANLLACVLGIHAQLGRIVFFTPKSSIARLDMLANVVNAIAAEHGDVQKLVRPLIKRANAVFGKRHRFMHSGWGYSNKHGEVTSHNLPPKKRFDESPVPLSELEKLIADIRSVNTDAWNARMHVELAMRPGAAGDQVHVIEIGPRNAK